MTKNNLKTSFVFRVIIAALILAAIIFLPVAVLAEGEVETVDNTSDLGGDPAADLSTTESGIDATAPLPEAPAPETDSNPVSQTSELSEVNGDSDEPEPTNVSDD